MLRGLRASLLHTSSLAALDLRPYPCMSPLADCCCAGLGALPAGSKSLGSIWSSSTHSAAKGAVLSCAAGLRASPAGGTFPPLPPPTGLLRPEGGLKDFSPPQQTSASPSGYQPPPSSLSAGSQSGPPQPAAVLQVCPLSPRSLPSFLAHRLHVPGMPGTLHSAMQAKHAISWLLNEPTVKTAICVTNLDSNPPCLTNILPHLHQGVPRALSI